MTDPADHPVVQTAEGTVRGVWRGTSAAFLGIPFAEAPVGDLRFLAPVPRAPWTGVRDAVDYGATAQRRPFGEVTAIPEPSIPGDDILTVNVFTPAPGDTDAALPVLFWIHGGGYKAGSPASPWYDGFAFNRDGVVTVSVGYRLGFDGFGAIDGAPANRGLLDQIEGLRWVQRTIAAFGGDPGRVTIGGQSSGGGSVLALLASPLATGLFHAAISQSGSLSPVPLDLAQRRSAQLAELAGVPATLDGFRGLTEDQVLDAAAQLEAPPTGPPGSPQDLVDGLVAGPGILGLQFLPQADPASLPADWVSAVAADPRPLLLGAVAHEFTLIGWELAPALGDADPVELIRASPLGDLTDEFVAAHPELSGPLLVGQLLTVSTFRRWVPEVATARSRGAQGPTWAYDFRWPNPAHRLATHCCELPFTWDNLADPAVASSCGPGAPLALADAMHGAWVRFVTTHEAPWAQWRPESRRTMVFDADPSERDGYGFETRAAPEAPSTGVPAAPSC
ncbi:MAG TPA: carboxylesterase family protein [Arachnia sp.]|nr:carboxylesterase family protein [Arachnia sp.]